MADVCQRHGVKLLTYGSLVRLTAPAALAAAGLSTVGGAWLTLLPLSLVWRLPFGQVAPCTGAQPV